MDTERSRKRVINPETWAKQVRQRRRNSGKEYAGRTGKVKAAARFDLSMDYCKHTGNRPRTTKKHSLSKKKNFSLITYCFMELINITSDDSTWKMTLESWSRGKKTV